MNIHVLRKQIKAILYLFIAGLLVSGLTAFPLDMELQIARNQIFIHSEQNAMAHWINMVADGVHETSLKYPFIAYGTDWLAFAHLVLAIVFIGPLRDPIKNIWVIEFGMIACLAIFPLALIAGSLRGIPLFWQCIDCSFGVGGGILLYICWKKVQRLEALTRFRIL